MTAVPASVSGRPGRPRPAASGPQCGRAPTGDRAGRGVVARSRAAGAVLRAGLQRACRAATDAAHSGALLPGLVVTGDDQPAAPRRSSSSPSATAGLTHLTAVSGTNLTLVLASVLLLARWAGVRARGLLVVGVLCVLGFVLVSRPEPVGAAGCGHGFGGSGRSGQRRASRGAPRARRSRRGAARADAVDGRCRPASRSRCAPRPASCSERPRSATRWRPGCRGGWPRRSRCRGQHRWRARHWWPACPGRCHWSRWSPTCWWRRRSARRRCWGWAVASSDCWCRRWAAWSAGSERARRGDHRRRRPRRPATRRRSLAWPSGSLAMVVLVLLSGAGLVGASWVMRHRWLTLAAAVLLLLAVVRPVPSLGWPPEGWVLVMCDVGQGDAFALRTGPDEAVVVDAWPRSGAGRRVPRRPRRHPGAGAGPDSLPRRPRRTASAGALAGRRVGAVQVTAPWPEPVSTVRDGRGTGRRTSTGVPVSGAPASGERSAGRRGHGSTCGPPRPQRGGPRATRTTPPWCCSWRPHAGCASCSSGDAETARQHAPARRAPWIVSTPTCSRSPTTAARYQRPHLPRRPCQPPDRPGVGVGRATTTGTRPRT